MALNPSQSAAAGVSLLQLVGSAVGSFLSALCELTKLSFHARRIEHASDCEEVTLQLAPNKRQISADTPFSSDSGQSSVGQKQKGRV